MKTSPKTASSRIVSACRHLAAIGFAAATDGNISMRIGPGAIVITASGCRFRDITSADILSVRNNWPLKAARKRPSSELPMHLALYEHGAGLGAVVHCHPPNATAFAAAGTALTPNVFPEVILDLGHVPLVRYSMPSTEELGTAVARHVQTSGGALLAHHGAVTWGATLDEAVNRMEKLEHVAGVELRARSLGGPRQLGHEQVTELLAHHPLSSRRRQ